MTHQSKLLIGSSIAIAIGLTACGDGGGYDRPSGLAPPPTTPPPPTTTPPPPCEPTTPWDYC